MKALSKASGSVRRRTLLAAACAAAGLGLVSHAAAGTGPVSLSVIDRDRGGELSLWRHDGKLFVAGHPGARYGLRVSNRTDHRVLVVISVDGVNVLSGETAGYGQRGYVLDPYETYEVTGWRKSNTEVAVFNFASLSASYAARTGRPGDVGVIGMAVFNEKAEPPPSPAEAAPARPTWRTGRGVTPAPPLDLPAPPPLPIPPAMAPMREAPAGSLARSSAPPAETAFAQHDERLGTAHGAREPSAIMLVNFERATPYPQSTWRIEYDTYAHLVARGVVRSFPSFDHRPRPFPLEPASAGYVPDPPPWR